MFFIVWRMVNRFCGVVLSVLSVFIMFVSLVLVGNWISVLGFCLIEMLVFCVIIVCLLDSGLGWLIIGVVLIVMDRLLCVIV